MRESVRKDLDLIGCDISEKTQCEMNLLAARPTDGIAAGLVTQLSLQQFHPILDRFRNGDCYEEPPG